MKIALHYSLQVAEGERTQQVMADGLEDIAWADRNGFSAVVFAEHHFMDDGWIPRPMILAASAAAVTKKIRVGTDITLIALHHPVAIAEEAAVIDNLSGGRFILGVGLGWMPNEYAGFGVPYKQRAAIYERSIGHVRRLLAGAIVSDTTGHHRFENARIRPLPVNPAGVPLWMGGVKDIALPRIARLADAWVMWPGATLNELVRQRKLFLELRAAAGLPPPSEQPFRREAFVAETDERAWALYAEGLRHEYGHVYKSLHPTYPANDSIDNLRRWGENMFVVGSPETVAAQLAQYEDELGATECMVRCQLPTVSRDAVREALRGFGEVIGILQRRKGRSKT
jgi:alkanesulfonate monooxygenase SsuD/methylene tetrahydromethanopterin reductase-like flavin-dependent oxidoreductase (luciferase family)